MVSSDFLEALDVLTQLDPVGTYAERGAAAVAKLVRARRVDLVPERGPAIDARGDGTPHARESNGILEDGVMPLLLRQGRAAYGVLRLHPPEGASRFSPEESRLARWAARLFARQLGYVARFATAPARGGADGVQAALARTTLSRREREVVALLVAGRPTREIAARTGLTVATIHTYLKRIYPKLGVHSRVELVARLAGTAQPEARRGARPSARRASDASRPAEVDAHGDRVPADGAAQLVGED